MPSSCRRSFRRAEHRPQDRRSVCGAWPRLSAKRRAGLCPGRDRRRQCATADRHRSLRYGRGCVRSSRPSARLTRSESEDGFQPDARRGAAIRFRCAGRILLGLGQTGGGADAQARVDAIIGPGLDVAPVGFTADGLVEVEVQTPATVSRSSASRDVAGRGSGALRGRLGFGQGDGGRAAASRLGRATSASRQQGDQPRPVQR